MSLLHQLPFGLLGGFSDAFHFILHQQEARTGGVSVGGPHQVLELLWAHVKLSGVALALALAIAAPLGLWLGHRGRGEFFAVAAGNAGRAIPELALIALIAAFIGVGFRNVAIALAVLGIPPILTNTFVGVRQVDRGAVDAARGMGMSEPRVMWSVELPLALPTIMGGVRTAAINIVATATIAPLAGVSSLGDFILSRNVYGDSGVLAGAICVALLALTVELTLAGAQRLLQSRLAPNTLAPAVRGAR